MEHFGRGEDMRSVIALLTFAALSAALTACGSDSEEGSQPRPDVTTFEQGDFDDIPLLAASEPVSAPTEEDGTVARSYLVRNTTPREVLGFYENQLSEHTVVSPPESIGRDTFRAIWELDRGRQLTVSATPERHLQGAQDFENVETITQYSLTLAPRDA